MTDTQASISHEVEVNPIDENGHRIIVEVEHPLMTSWTFWCDKTVRGATADQFKNSLLKIHSIATIEGFWQVFTHIPHIDNLAAGVSYHLMRDKREPMWEDKANCNGGTWRFKIAKKDSPRVWQEVLLAAVGEQFSGVLSCDDMVVGISMSIRDRVDTLQIWNNDSRLAEEANNSLLGKVQQLFSDDPVTFLASFYKSHHMHQAYEGAKAIDEIPTPL